MICRLFGHSPRYWEWSRAWRCRWCQVDLVPRAKQESRAFTTVSVPRPPANPQSLDQFVDGNGYCWDRHGTHPDQGGGQCYVIPHMHPKPTRIKPGPPSRK